MTDRAPLPLSPPLTLTRPPLRRATVASGRTARRFAGALMVATLGPAVALAAPAVTVPAQPVLRPEAPLPADALVPGAQGVGAILCTAESADNAPAPTPAATVRVQDPWAAQPVMTGAGDPVAVRFFKRGRTLIFDAGAEVVYIERDHRRFTYIASGPSGVVKWRGLCQAERS